MRVFLIVAGVLVALALVVVAIGYSLPVKHRAQNWARALGFSYVI